MCPRCSPSRQRDTIWHHLTPFWYHLTFLTRLGKKTNSMNYAKCQIFKFSAKFWSLNVQFRNYFKNIIFIACKWCKICKYFVDSMVISWSTCQKEEKEYLIYTVLWRFQICRNLRVFFCLICVPKISQFTVQVCSWHPLIPSWYLPSCHQVTPS